MLILLAVLMIGILWEGTHAPSFRIGMRNFVFEYLLLLGLFETGYGWYMREWPKVIIGFVTCVMTTLYFVIGFTQFVENWFLSLILISQISVYGRMAYTLKKPGERKQLPR